MFAGLQGKKTYITGFLGIVGALGAYFMHQADLASTAQLILTALLGMFIRQGVAQVQQAQA